MSPPSHSKLPVLPLKAGVLFPSQWMPMTVGRARSLAALDLALLAEGKQLVVASQITPDAAEPERKDLFDFGTVAVVKGMLRTEEAVHVVVQGISRVRLYPIPASPISASIPFEDDDKEDAEPLMAWVEAIPDPTDEGPAVEALQREMLVVARRVFELIKPQGLSLEQFLADVNDPLYQVYRLGGILGLDVGKEQVLLAATTRIEALRLMHDYLTHEVQVLEIRKKIANDAEEKIGKQQREFMLRQQMQAIRDELGDQDPEKADIDELSERLEEAGLPEAAQKEIEKELARLERMPTAAAEYQMTRTYIEFVLDLPWSSGTEDLLDLEHARRILDEEHFDLADVKDRIVEHLAVMKLNPNAKAPILCFVGPPGVGKTSLGQSIAHAIGRSFERMSLGGMHDEAELRGHRRTYIGAMPGRILQALRRAESRNPLLMLDEIDKLGSDFRGDPSAALMEILDPAQNSSFRDNYLNLPFDLSQVFFITTANTLEGIPAPLLDRMEVLRLSGYSDREKLEIARRYLLPRRLAEAGLSHERLALSDECLMHVIRRYTREAGVRELERMLGSIARKVAMRFAVEPPRSDEQAPVVVTVAELPVMLGPERFFLGEMRNQMGPGVAAGLAWTEAGGDVLYVEAVVLPKAGELMLTGHLGTVMQESAKAAQSYVLSQAELLGLNPERIAASGVHIHVPAGAIAKDGPSAGVTLVTALASLYGNRAVRRDTAMTGEITLSGLILPVGGVKEKVLAAHRAGIRRVVIPKANERNLRELPDEVMNQVEFIAVETIEELLRATIPGLSARQEEGKTTEDEALTTYYHAAVPTL